MVSGVYRKFEIPDILHIQDDQEEETPTETAVGQLQLAEDQRKLQQALSVLKLKLGHN